MVNLAYLTVFGILLGVLSTLSLQSFRSFHSWVARYESLRMLRSEMIQVSQMDWMGFLQLDSVQRVGDGVYLWERSEQGQLFRIYRREPISDQSSTKSSSGDS